MEQTFSFDNVLIKPKPFSSVKSRSEVDTSVNLYGKVLDIPIMSASMSAFDTMNPDSKDISWQFAGELSNLGGIHIFSRGTPFPQRFEAASSLAKAGNNVGIAVSLGEFYSHREKLENQNFFVSIDIANGSIISDIDWEGSHPLIVGNFGNPYAVTRSDLTGKLIFKFGIGSGASCSTRLKTGVGAPQGWLIHKVSKPASKRNVPIISDGGIKNNSDFAKAIALGADVVMMGYMLASAEETPWEPIKINDSWYKPYRGMASFEEKNSNSHVEGISGFVPYQGKTLKEIVFDLQDGLKSAMSYSDSKTIDDFKAKTEFIFAPVNDIETGTRLYE